MAFNPSSTIYLCNVPIDNTYTHQIYFKDTTEQREYFAKRTVKTFANYLTVRKTLPDGSLQSSVKVDANIDTLQSLLCNYLYYQNANHGIKYFYAFITKMVYINENTTEIFFETDVYQTWLNEASVLPSYVVREHSSTDAIGDNVVPEKFNIQDFKYKQAVTYSDLNSWGYLVATTEKQGADGVRGQNMSGIYQGLYYYFYRTASSLNNFLDSIESEGGDCVVFIAVIPEFSMKNSINEGASGFLHYSNEPASSLITIPLNLKSLLFDGYTPRNSKMYTAPYLSLYVTNHAGEQAVYRLEDFAPIYNFEDERSEIYFRLVGDVSASPSLTIYPKDYQGIESNYDCGLSISGFPQCSFNSDTFKLWLAKNQYGVAIDLAKNVGMIAGGVAVTAGTAGAGAAAGVAAIGSGVAGILNTANSVYQASKEPNKSHGGAAKNNLLTALQMNKFDFYWQMLRYEHAKMIDDFFTMYGYQTNQVKTPNVSARQAFNYVQTIDVNIVGGIPCDDMNRLKQMYNNGVTFWKPTATFGSYIQDNYPYSGD